MPEDARSETACSVKTASPSGLGVPTCPSLTDRVRVELCCTGDSILLVGARAVHGSRGVVTGDEVATGASRKASRGGGGPLCGLSPCTRRLLFRCGEDRPGIKEGGCAASPNMRESLFIVLLDRPTSPSSELSFASSCDSIELAGFVSRVSHVSEEPTTTTSRYRRPRCGGSIPVACP